MIARKYDKIKLIIINKSIRYTLWEMKRFIGLKTILRDSLDGYKQI
jgi:hypothetical protein